MLKAASPRRLKRATSFATLRSLRNPAWRATRANETPWASARSALARRTRSARSLVALTIRRRAACSAIVSGRSGSCWWVAISSLRPPGVSPMPSHASTHFRLDPLVALWEVASLTGARQGELLGLQWTDIRLDSADMRIERALVGIEKGAGHPTFDEPKTTKSRRTIPLEPEAVEALKAHRDRQAFERQTLGDP